MIVKKHTLSFDYDGLSQLIDANISNIDSQYWTSSYDYQYNGNIQLRTQNSEPSTQYSYNGDEMTMAGGYSLNYDLNGNLKTENSELTTQNYEYNWDNKLRSATIGSDSIDCKYDPAGNRIFKGSTVSGSRKYILDTASDVPKVILVLEPLGNNQFGIKRTYVYTDREVLAQQDGSTNKKYYYLNDRLGSVRLMIDDTGAVKNSYTYDPWGKVVGNETQETISNPYRFAGYFWDDEINMYYCNARHYDPELARFASRDPVKGCFSDPMTLQKYLYCLANPVNMTDPTGKYGEVVNTVTGMFAYYSALAVALDETDWWSILDNTIAVNKYREMIFRTTLPMVQLFDLARKQGWDKTLHTWTGEDPPQFPSYGNFCGLGGDKKTKPIDDVDSACSDHDNCYDKKGRGNKECDRELCKGVVEATCSTTHYPIQCQAARAVIGAAYCTRAAN